MSGRVRYMKMMSVCHEKQPNNLVLNKIEELLLAIGVIISFRILTKELVLVNNVVLLLLC